MNLRTQMLRELESVPVLEKLVRDSYGNYVLQTAIETADSVHRHQFIALLMPVLNQVKQTSYGKRILSKILHHAPHMILNSSVGL